MKSFKDVMSEQSISTTPPAKVGFNDIVIRKHESGNHEVVRRGGAYMHLKKGELLSKSDMKDMSSNRAKFHLEEVDQSEEAQLEEGFKKGDFIKTPTGEIHRVFGVTGNSLETAPYRGRNGYGGGTTVHKTKATKVPTPKDVTEEVELDEAIKLGTKVKIHAPGKDYHDKVGHVGEIRDGLFKGAPKKYTIDYDHNPATGHSKSVQLDKKNVKLHTEEVELDEMTQGKSYTQQQLSDKIKSGNWEAVTDIKPGRHVEMRHHTGKRVTVHVKEETQQQGEHMSAMDQYIAALGSRKSAGEMVSEKKLTPAELKKREEVAKAIERDNPSMDKSKKMAIATATAKKVAEETIEEKLTDDAKKKVQAALGPKSSSNTMRQTSGPARAAISLAKTNPNNMVKKEEADMHYCAKHVFSERFGEGLVVEGAHAEPNEQGLIEWYDVDFGGTIRRVMTEKVKVMHAEYHMNHKKKMSEEDKPHTIPKTEREKDLAAAAHPKDKITHKDILVKRGVIAKEEMAGEMHPDAAKVLKHIKPQHHGVYKPFLKKGVYKGDYADRSAVLSAAEKAGHIQEGVDPEKVDEAMISYSDFQDKIAAHRKAGNKVVDDKYTEKKATYTTVDREGMGRKVTHTPTGSKQEHLGNLKGDDDQAEVKPVEKRGRGRPAGTKSGARH